MPWKTEIDRLINRAIVDGARGNEKDADRVGRLLQDLLELMPERPQNYYHVGTATELVPAVVEDLEEPEGPDARWRFLGRLESAARRGKRELVDELLEDDHFEGSLDHPEGRVALRAVGRMLLRAGEDQQVFDWYARHLSKVDDEGSQRDADFLLEEALRRADRYERGERRVDETRERLDRAAAFVESAGLDARSGAKVDRKLGRLHQLGEEWDEAQDCYRRALERLPEDDAYRSVLVGDLALAVLGVRGTLDLLPDPDRERRDEAIQILEADGAAGEGRSYNAIYTLGVLHYEQDAWEPAATCFGEADTLMRENRAKARIVHARARFLGAHSQIELGLDEEDLEKASKTIRRDAGAANLDDEIKDRVFDALRAASPENAPARPARRRREKEADESPADLLTEAADGLEDDPHAALGVLDRIFRGRPDFDTWFTAYRMRIEALGLLGERDEALRTWERFRGKLYQRDVFDRIEALLTAQDSPLATLLDDADRFQELADLYEVMPEREEKCLEALVASAEAHLERGEDADVARAVCLAREAVAREAEGADELLAQAEKAAKKAKLDLSTPSEEDGRQLVEDLGEAPILLVVGGDEGRRPHLASFNDLAQRVGFEGSWVFTGSQPPRKTLDEIKRAAEHADAILVHHGTDAEMRDAVRKLAASREIPLREAPWVGLSGLSGEVLRALDDAFEVVEE